MTKAAVLELMRRRVARGARLLDRKRLNWCRMIDRPTLDLGNCYRCVLGQLFSSFDMGEQLLGRFFKSLRWDIRHGFYVDDWGELRAHFANGDHLYRHLTIMWLDEIDARLESSPVVTQETLEPEGVLP